MHAQQMCCHQAIDQPSQPRYRCKRWNKVKNTVSWNQPKTNQGKLPRKVGKGCQQAQAHAPKISLGQHFPCQGQRRQAADAPRQ